MVVAADCNSVSKSITSVGRQFNPGSSLTFCTASDARRDFISHHENIQYCPTTSRPTPYGHDSQKRLVVDVDYSSFFALL